MIGPTPNFRKNLNRNTVPDIGSVTPDYGFPPEEPTGVLTDEEKLLFQSLIDSNIDSSSNISNITTAPCETIVNVLPTPPCPPPPPCPPQTPDVTYHAHNGSSTQTVNTTSSVTLFNTEVRTDANYSYSAGGVTVVVADWYTVTYEVTCNKTSEGAITFISSIYVDGIKQDGTDSCQFLEVDDANACYTTTCSTEIFLAANEEVTIETVTNTGTLNTVVQSCRLTIRKRA